MTINPSAWILLAMYIVLAQKRGYDLNKLSGTIQADILKEYMAQKEYIFPIEPSVRIVRDCITYCAKNLKRYNPINISGYHISEAGASPVHEAAFTLANLLVYVEEVLKTGMHVDEFARVSLSSLSAKPISSRRLPSFARCGAAMPSS